MIRTLIAAALLTLTLACDVAATEPTHERAGEPCTADTGETGTSPAPDLPETCEPYTAPGYCCDCRSRSECDPKLACWPSEYWECVEPWQAWCANDNGSLDECRYRCFN